jgi:hypothetical protein
MTEKIEGGRELKRRVGELLRADDAEFREEKLRGLPARRAVNPLLAFLCNRDEQLRWRAVAALGAVVANLAAADLESARVVMRRMIWQLNDESGGIGWGIPEAMGEIMARHRGLAGEYAHLLVSYICENGNFLEHVPLQRGVLWGLGRLARVYPRLVQEAAPHVRQFLEAGDDTLRGLAVLTMGSLGAEAARAQVEALVDDEAEVCLYVDGRQRRCRIGDLARKALKEIEAAAALQDSGGLFGASPTNDKPE